MSHPDDSELAEFAQGNLAGAAMTSVESHLAACSDCRALVAQVVKVLSPARVYGPHRGLVVGRYVVLDSVGAGALGEVYSAHDSTLERTVALKWLYPSPTGLDRDALRAQLLLEARALAKVQHPNVVVVHDVLAHEEADVIVMELVQGARSLRLALGPTTPWQRTVELFRSAADGLAAAHDAGVIHRDFKPDNVLVDGSGRVVVVDFGLARQADVNPAGAQPTTATRSQLSGTPAYLAPERWSGAPADAAADQFSFCVSLYECLTGRLPFTQVAVEARLDEMRRGPPALPAEVSPQVVQVLRRGLAFDPKERWPSMREVRARLDAALQAPRRRRQRLLVGALVSLTAAVVALGAFQLRGRCESADAPVRDLWSAGRRDSVLRALLATNHPAAADLSRQTLKALDALATSLAEARRRACVATAYEGDSDALLAARQACLSRRLSDVDALLRGFETADGKVVERAVMAVESVSPPQACLESSLTNAEPAPAGAAGAGIEAVQGKVATMRAARLLGRVKDSVALGEATVREARAAGWKPLTSDALLEWSLGLDRLSKFDEARERGLEALELALLARDEAQAFDAAVALAYLDGVDRKQSEAGLTWVRLAKALVAPQSQRGSQAVRLGNVEAVLLMRADRAADAVPLLTTLARDVEAKGQLQTVNGARLYSNLSAALRESGRPAEGIEASQRSLALMEQVLSPSHPDVAAALNNLGSAQADLGKLDEAQGSFERSVELRERLFGPDALVLATPHYNLGELAFRRGDGATALEEYGRSRAIVEKTNGPDDDDAWDSKMGEGLALGLLGRHDEAVTLLEQTVPQLEKRRLPAWNVAQAKLGLATSLRALGRDEARVSALLAWVLALEGPRHDAQRSAAARLATR
ncbi:MAG: protein kinase [Myxococcaceae bacterium]|jgi:tetratricopeptide (TPR) repeat protein/tRNA A-37 threonylcarbamoyl transferase component Bud32|nr:protein kinase [Myxococcaceae bacterium]